MRFASYRYAFQMRAAPLRLIDPAGRTWTARADRPPTATYGRRFFTVFTDDFAAIARHPDIKGRPTALALLHQLPMVLDFDRWQFVHQQELAFLLSTSQPVISRNLAALVKAGALEKKGGRGTSPRYRLARSWGWRGTPSQYHAAERDRSEGEPERSPDGRKVQADSPVRHSAFGTDYTLCGNS